MNSAKLAAALNTLSLGMAELAEAIALEMGDIQSEAGEREVRLGANPTATTPPPAAPAGAAIPPAPPELPPSFDELPPEEWEDPGLAALVGKIEAVPVRVARGDGDLCPDHDLAWEVVPGGVSKRTGKQYTAFWHCPSFGCKVKPSKEWQDEHPTGRAA